jgi:hypothetical protein
MNHYFGGSRRIQSWSNLSYVPGMFLKFLTKKHENPYISAEIRNRELPE